MSRYSRFFLPLIALTALGATLGAGCEGDGDLALPTPDFPLAKADAVAKPPLPEAAADFPNGRAVVLAVVEAVNSERARHDLRPLTLDPVLSQIADFYARRMIEGGFFGHQDPYDGSTVDVRASNFGYAYRKVGENLAAGHTSVAEVIAHWMRSPGHRANILDPVYTEIGIAVKQGGEYGIYWVQEFGSPLTTPDASDDKSEGGVAASDPEGADRPIATDSANPVSTSEPAAAGATPAAPPTTKPDSSPEKPSK